MQCAVRHQAAADTLATAELLLKLWPQVRGPASRTRLGGPWPGWRRSAAGCRAERRTQAGGARQEAGRELGCRATAARIGDVGHGALERPAQLLGIRRAFHAQREVLGFRAEQVVDGTHRIATQRLELDDRHRGRGGGRWHFCSRLFLGSRRGLAGHRLDEAGFQQGLQGFVGLLHELAQLDRAALAVDKDQHGTGTRRQAACTRLDLVLAVGGLRVDGGHGQGGWYPNLTTN